MKWAMIGGGVIVALAGVIGIYVWGELNGAFLKKRSFADLKALLEPGLQIHVPTTGAAPYPTVLAFSGCGGVRRVQGFYADRAKANGVLTIVVDSFGPRGIGYEEAIETVCSGRKLRGGERAGDVWAAL
ncbi:MAG: hypothetical protein MI723_13240, partial [Caulobacterales bacterium]|nr:hypothetical protein [Caulobacterales bacterium]